ncbi:membrane protein [Nocardiopsis ansamitocini]|uniref:Membrane protein n=2 Tax=Nocardiopsis ansamitocini TaxID=1670832 RepID=A0A9W6P6T6_9ACTN|nr:lysylphosphatidylglycerol synthase transmembrane domain-containing protein [Nocardiopsis ansamitocini]GLU48524.1 membrane protein [Nocardiopsis ansamitocini]
MAVIGSGVLFLVLLFAVLTSGPPGTAEAEELRGLLPESLLFIAAGLANITVILLISVTVVERLLRRAYRQLVRALSAAALGYVLVLCLNAALIALTADMLPGFLSASDAGGIASSPLHAYLAAVTAYLRAARPVQLPRVAGAMTLGIAVTAASVVLSGYTTVVSLLLTFLIGLICADLVFYLVGSGAQAPLRPRLDRELSRFGMEPLSLTPRGGDAEGNQHFVAETVGRRLDVVLLRADMANGVWKRLLTRIALRDPAAPPVLLGVRRRVEHTALLEYAAGAAGAATPRLLAVGELDLGTAVLVREHVRSRALGDVTDDTFDDAFVDRIWDELRLLHRHRVAHRNLSAATIALRADGRVMFTGLSTGTIAAGPLALSLDTAALITTIALRVGPRRAVASAVRSAGTETVAATLPFIQGAGLPLALRRALRAHRTLLGRIREEISLVAPDAPAQAAKVERMRPRAVVSVVAATVVGLVLAYQLTGVDLSTIRNPSAPWAWGALAMSLACMLAAALSLIGFSPVRIALWRTLLVQFAASFIRIATPAGLGSLAINTRYLARSGATTPEAVAAVGVSQLAGLITHVPLLLLFAYLAGTAYPGGDFAPSLALLIVAGALSLVVAAVLALPRLRRALLARARPYFRGVLPQLLDLIQQPRRLALGMGGTLLLTFSFVLCLYFSVVAFGHDPGVVAIGVVFLAGNAIGSAAPSPGGIGAVEAALIGGLTAVAGVPAAVALPAVLLFRVLTFWLPVLPGWAAFSHLQRVEAI